MQRNEKQPNTKNANPTPQKKAKQSSTKSNKKNAKRYGSDGDIQTKSSISYSPVDTKKTNEKNKLEIKVKNNKIDIKPTKNSPSNSKAALNSNADVKQPEIKVENNKIDKKPTKKSPTNSKALNSTADENQLEIKIEDNKIDNKPTEQTPLISKKSPVSKVVDTTEDPEIKVEIRPENELPGISPRKKKAKKSNKEKCQPSCNGQKVLQEFLDFMYESVNGYIPPVVIGLLTKTMIDNPETLAKIATTFGMITALNDVTSIYFNYCVGTFLGNLAFKDKEFLKDYLTKMGNGNWKVGFAKEMTKFVMTMSLLSLIHYGLGQVHVQIINGEWADDNLFKQAFDLLVAHPMLREYIYGTFGLGIGMAANKIMDKIMNCCKPFAEIGPHLPENVPMFRPRWLGQVTLENFGALMSTMALNLGLHHYSKDWFADNLLFPTIAFLSTKGFSVWREAAKNPEPLESLVRKNRKTAKDNKLVVADDPVISNKDKLINVLKVLATSSIGFVGAIATVCVIDELRKAVDPTYGQEKSPFVTTSIAFLGKNGGDVVEFLAKGILSRAKCGFFQQKSVSVPPANVNTNEKDLEVGAPLLQPM